MSEPGDTGALHSALGTELFVLQSAASSTISEAGTRSTIYLATLSGGLVALGFAGSSPSLLAVMTFTVLPTIFMLGWFTVVRLVDTSVESITARHRMARIRAYFASLHPLGPTLIAQDDPRTNGELGVRYARSSFLFTMASMVGAVNSVVGGALVTLVLTIGLGLRTLPATLFGIAAGLVLLLATLRYERRRIASVNSGATDASQSR
ncbi:hypothetical protein HF576_10085 [Microbacterium sp. CFH 90308]|uniref:Uncharacterized protein n=1 Tax=Microbacterium salsuginis TaxID=2722803 RepID=A0ABX1KFN9_9MICO|nr:hypothetical protein [Microbacterium sp. CFH 90308]NLP84201.1 hypothetical protein [Microbacterium sp. CFH 90308]